jgi:hypothetical protein
MNTNNLLNKQWVLLFLLLLLPVFFCFSAYGQQPLTIAEKSKFTRTSLYSEVMDFISALQQQSPYIRVETIAVSTEGREIPLLILGKPAPSSPLELKYDNRKVVYIQANIHAGEVEGKEAALMLARDILSGDKSFLLDNLIILIAPIYNADGNEKISTEHRTNQVGPEQGVGVRYNGQNLDLNRDAMKLESPEDQGLVANVLMRWNPLLLVDCHTTNGSPHKESVTYSWPLNPNGDMKILEYMRDQFLPQVQKNLKEKYNVLSIPYGNFADYKDIEKGWTTFSHLPRFVTNYIGLRNRMSILDENYSGADYKTRVTSCYYFLLSILEYVQAHAITIEKLAAEADQRTVLRGFNPSSSEGFAVEVDQNALKEPVAILSWELEAHMSPEGWPYLEKKDKEKTYVLPYFADFTPKKTIPYPRGYFIYPPIAEVVDKLLQHGIVVDMLTEEIEVEVEAFYIDEIKASERAFQGHHLDTIKGTYEKERISFPSGTIFVGTDQPLGNLAAYLLEAESDDGLLVWNFFDRYIIPQWGSAKIKYPVNRLLLPKSFPRKAIRE